MVCWFAGLFYLVRLFIYHKEAQTKEESVKEILQSQYALMSKRLLSIITWPSAFLTTFFGVSMLLDNPILVEQSWMQIKLAFILLLWLYTYSCQIILNQIKIGQIRTTEIKLRIWNEVATLIMFAIIFMAVLKNSISWIYATLSLVGLAVLLMISIKLYKKYKTK
jgi:putative membrane protein